tara:strand:+ start:192 stop:473 length:282 start_codon:yes stop_codon:yes gene_type:complete
MLNKKAQGLSVTTIIVAIIGLIILVAIILMLTGKLGDFGTGTESVGNPLEACEGTDGQGGDLKELGVECDAGDVEIVASDSLGTGKKCCVTPS